MKEKIGILCGFEAEATIAKSLTPRIAMSGAIETKARERAHKLVKDGATYLLSFGVAGGLLPELTPEDIIVASSVQAKNGQSWECDKEFVSILKENISSHRSGNVYGSTYLVPTSREKRKIYEETKCIIVDMESHIVAEVATQHRIPFGVLRGVSDGINNNFPRAALVAVNEDGSSNNAAMYKSLLLNPFQIPALMQLFKNTGTSLMGLSKIISILSQKI